MESVYLIIFFVSIFINTALSKLCQIKYDGFLCTFLYVVSVGLLLPSMLPLGSTCLVNYYYLEVYNLSNNTMKVF
jgi:hypothetical protein